MEWLSKEEHETHDISNSEADWVIGIIIAIPAVLFVAGWCLFF